MTLAQKIAENKRKARAWIRSLHQKKEDRLDEACRFQRESLNKKKEGTL